MRIAIACWQDRVSPVFDIARQLFVVTFEEGREIRRDRLLLPTGNLWDRVRILSEQGVDVLLCGAISRSLEKALESAGIRVCGFLAGECDPVLVSFANARGNAVAPARFPGRRRSGRPATRPDKSRPPTSRRRRSVAKPSPKE